ncbi:MAG: extracellular solute-binding protein family 1 [Paenibacillaceae bacterium]|jgi:putative aldouronate transport system substrate-binding protein|nr:extracellular solute-binding protein family 1 [Paenibacillaceae bacterium]
MVKKKGQTAWLALLLALLLALTACSQGTGNGGEAGKPEQDTGASPQAADASAPAGEFAKRLKIKWMMPTSELSRNSYAVKYLEETFNVEIDYYSIPQADYVQKQQILLTSGDLPDIMFVYDPNQLFKFAGQGLIAELPVETIGKHAPETKAVMDSFAPQGWYYTRMNGVNYGLPLNYFTGQFNAKQGWRTDLLKKAGVDAIPATIDEMTQAFAKLKNIGVYGMTSNGNSYYLQFWSIFGAYGVMPTQWMLKDGKVVNAAVQPEAKMALTVLADWYAKGYIDPEFVTGVNIDKKLIEGKVAYTHVTNPTSYDLSNPNSTYSAAKKADPQAVLEMAPLPKGPDGKQGGWAWGTSGSIFAFGKHMEKDPEKVERILKIINAIQNDDQVFMDVGAGIRGTHWDYNNPADEKSGIKFLPPYDDRAKLATEGIVNSFNTLFGGAPKPELSEKALGSAYMEQWNRFNVPVWDLFGKSDVLPSSGKFWGDLIKLKLEAYSQIIRGDKPVSYFDEFVQQWNKLGGTQLELEANELYSSVKGK